MTLVRTLTGLVVVGSLTAGPGGTERDARREAGSAAAAPATAAGAAGAAASAATASASAVGAVALERAARGHPASGASLAPSRLRQSFDDFNAPYDGLYHFVRIQFEARGRGGFGFGRRGRGREPLWAHDWPRAERNFLQIIDEATMVGAQTEGSNVYALDDPELFRFPIAYIVEVGYWDPSDEEVAALGEYLRKGGFLIVDDFRNPRELDNLQLHLQRALPEGRMMAVDPSDEIFDSFFRLVPDQIVPPYGGYPPLWYGIYEDNDRTKRLQVMINANNDMAEYWEFSDRGYYPIDLSNEAYKLGVNYVVYALTH